MVNNDSCEHIVFTDRENIPDMIRIDGTHKISQVESIVGSSIENAFAFKSSYFPCSCVNCLRTCSSDTCLYADARNIEEQTVRDKNSTSIDDPFGMQKLTVADLKFQLRERGLPIGGTKQVLVSRLLPFLISENEIL